MCAQISFFDQIPASWSVSELTNYLKDLLASDANLQDIWVQGEISNFSRPSSGHWYFTIKDSHAALKCVMWRNTAQRQNTIPREGDQLEVHGALGIYEVSGTYQLYADAIRPVGLGALYQEFLRLKERLEAQGLFDPGRKQAIPRWPHRIGLITSPTGAALRDMLNTLRRRYPITKVILVPTPVQGNEAPPGIVGAIQAMETIVQPDVILLARGGGSIEDLWAFNDERVAHAIAACSIPLISGVGHETDFTIADFVADMRAPTPTAAAEIATPDQADLRANLSDLNQLLVRNIQTILNSQRWQIDHLSNRLQLHSPHLQLRSERQRLDDLDRRIQITWQHHLEMQHAGLNHFERQLMTLNPSSVLNRGYAIVTDESGNVIHEISQVQPEMPLDVQISDGKFKAKTEI